MTRDADSTNPYVASQNAQTAAAPSRPRTRRILLLLAVACIGVAVGSAISAKLLRVHFPNGHRESESMLGHTMEAFFSSPISMTVGLLPTMGFYTSHGFLVIPGFLMALVGCAVYYQRGTTWALLTAFVGFVFWSHNNLLGFHALMSV